MLFFGRADTIGEEGPETNTLSTFLDSRCQPWAPCPPRD